ncbi:MAG: MgtC/SapB family protein [Acidobacteriota bacterium]
MPPTFDATAFAHVSVAALGGLAIGVEREWSGHAAGPLARFAGVRTFTLLGLVAGLCGWLWTAGLTGLSLVLMAGVGALVVVAYLSASRTDIDGTTEVAAFVVLAAGLLSGLGLIRVASGCIAITLLLLVEKRSLHGWVSRVDLAEMRAGARFAVMAAVILPLLPAGPFGPSDTIRPRVLWALVLLFSGLSFVGYVARRAVGAERGYALAGILGGLLSSTSVTMTFSRLSRIRPHDAVALAAGTLGANAVLFPRVLLATAVLALPLTSALWPAFVVPACIAVGLTVRQLRKSSAPAQVPRATDEENPLQVTAALQMAALFQVVLFVVAFATRWFGQAGIYGSAAVLGLVDMDALTISMANIVGSGTPPLMGARAIVIGATANTIVKLTMAAVVGRGHFRTLTVAGLAAIALALSLALWASYFLS